MSTIQLDIKTHSRTELLDVTGIVSERVNGIASGTYALFVPHTTAGITINENADPSVKADMLMELNKVIPFDDNIRPMVESMASLASVALEAYIREQGLRHEIQQLRIELDRAKRDQQVAEITDSDYFRRLQAKAQQLRRTFGENE